MPSKTLVVIDMQPEFKAAKNPNTVISVTAEIMKAMINHHAIVIVEYEGSGSSHKAFYDLLKDYPFVSRLTKKCDDGSGEIVTRLKRRGFPVNQIRVCGVNTDCCVASTVYGLLWRLKTSKIELVKSACNANRKIDWDLFTKNPNLSLV